MKFQAIDSTALIEIAIGAAVIAGVIYYARKQASAASDAVAGGVAAVQQTFATTLNPASPQTAVYGAVNAVGTGLTGDTGFDLGSYLYDLTHPSVVDANGVVITSAATPGTPPLTTATGF